MFNIARDRRWVLLIVAAMLALGGCRGASTPLFPEWVDAGPPPAPQPGSSNAFDTYAIAAQDAERAAPQYLARVFFTPGMRKETMRLMEGPLRTLASGTSKVCEFRFTPNNPFEPPPYHGGWRLLGKAMVWQIEESVLLENYDTAIHYAGMATKFGFDLTGGGATDASLGLQIVDEVRRAIAPALIKMTPGQLDALAHAIRRGYEAKPSLTVALRNERDNMLYGVQIVQEAFQKREYGFLRENLGSDIRHAIDHLKNIEGKTDKWEPYFQGFAAEAYAEAKWLEEAAQVSTQARSKIPPVHLADNRPWWRFSRHFFLTPQPLLAMHDATIARTRLLILEAQVLKQVRETGRAPQDLSTFDEGLRTDPYTGKTFVYRADGADYRLYSVGSDFRDDGGDTDESYAEPDLRVETGG